MEGSPGYGMEDMDDDMMGDPMDYGQEQDQMEYGDEQNEYGAENVSYTLLALIRVL
jgi:hypothetical protein